MEGWNPPCRSEKIQKPGLNRVEFHQEGLIECMWQGLYSTVTFSVDISFFRFKKMSEL